MGYKLDEIYNLFGLECLQMTAGTRQEPLECHVHHLNGLSVMVDYPRSELM